MSTASANRDSSHGRWWQRRWFKITASALVATSVVLAGVVEYFIHNAMPMVRKRVIETLSARFNAPVELDGLDISLVKGLEVSGYGLRVPYPGQTVTTGAKPPVLISIQHFEFHSDFKSLLHGDTHVGVVYVDNVMLDLPPGSQRGQVLGPLQNGAPADPQHPSTKPRIALIIDRVVCNNVKLVIEVADPRKEPHEFDIRFLQMDKKGGGLSYDYHAQLTNPIPRGDIDARGHLGPWNVDLPRQTPLNGNYTFSHADLSTIKGLRGTLSSTGHFDGVIENITVDGSTDTSDFALDISDHPLHLATRFHAYVDGTTGDTTLEQVNGVLDETQINARGTIQNLKGKGHDIALDAAIPKGQMRDVLYLGMKSRPPMMNGWLAMKTKIHVPPGKVRVAAKIELQGSLKIDHLSFNNPAVQNKLDAMSMRAQGKPKEVHDAGTDQQVEAFSALETSFVLSHQVLTFPSVHYELPGAHLQLSGAYQMQGDAFEFKGHVRTDATASQMVTGWKSLLLKPIDPFLKKNGAGVDLPISINGQKNDVHFSLALLHGDESSEDIKKDLHAKKNR